MLTWQDGARLTFWPYLAYARSVLIQSAFDTIFCGLGFATLFEDGYHRKGERRKVTAEDGDGDLGYPTTKEDLGTHTNTEPRQVKRRKRKEKQTAQQPKS
jgi:hypothetical protein